MPIFPVKLGKVLLELDNIAIVTFDSTIQTVVQLYIILMPNIRCHCKRYSMLDAKYSIRVLTTKHASINPCIIQQQLIRNNNCKLKYDDYQFWKYWFPLCFPGNRSWRKREGIAWFPWRFMHGAKLIRVGWFISTLCPVFRRFRYASIKGLGPTKMAFMLQTTFSSLFPWMKLRISIKIALVFVPKVDLMISWHWFKR